MQSTIFLANPPETFVKAAFAAAAKRCYHGNKQRRQRVPTLRGSGTGDVGIQAGYISA
jgi:hypothetical protein